MCSTPQKRRLHCIDKHQFPKNYNFIIIKDGIDRRTSMLLSPHRRRSSTLSSVNGGPVEAATSRRESSANGHGQGEEDVDHQPDLSPAQEEEWHAESRRYPTRLRGRGGFGHGQTSLGRDRGGGHSMPTHPSSKPAPATATTAADPMDALTSKLSALQFVPHSVRVARGRGRG